MLSTRQIKLVEESWDYVILNTEEAGIIFYNRLFQIAPDFRALFKEDIKSQSRKLIAMISFAVHKLHTLDEIVEDVKQLGVRHSKYNVKEEYYGVVAEALLWTLEKALGSRWDDEVKEAWVTVYSILSSVMIAASKEVHEKRVA